MKLIHAAFAVLLVSGGCVPTATYTVSTRNLGLTGECLVRGEIEIASVNFYNGRRDTVSVLIPPIAGVRTTELEALPPGGYGTVSFRVRCQRGRYFATEFIVAPLQAGGIEPARRSWAFSDNIRSVRHQSFIISGDRTRIILR
ncbi:MAG TPA: hypothetical protein VNK70_02170 [Candidatus Paceibacterota bacterium]|nr:hypothetical protein [Candidatus Paceibacterota bacterium]